MTQAFEIITSPERLASIAVPWRSLWQDAGADVFQSHEWINSWSQIATARSATRLRIAVAWEDDRMVAALPLVTRRQMPLRRLEWAAQDLTDYCDALLEPGADGSILRPLWSAVCRTGGFDVVRLTQVRPNAPARALLEGAETASGRLSLRDNQQPCLGIANSWSDGQAWFRSLNKKMRNNFTRGHRILSELGGEVAFHIVDPAVTSVAPLLDQVLALKRRWLESHGPLSSSQSGWLERQRMVLNATARTGQMRVFLLTCGDTIAAVSVNFVYPTKLQAYLTAYDPQFERASPGTLLIVDYVKWALDRRLEYVDFLRGDEAFKYRFANSETRIKGYIGGHSMFGRVALEQLGWYSRARAGWRRWQNGSSLTAAAKAAITAPPAHEH